MLDNSNDTIINQKISDYIPIACHYDPTTLITKNGDLIKIISISGFEPNDTNFNNINLREVIRTAITNYVNDNKIAIYIHTLNNFRNIEIGSNYSSDFAKNIHKKWNQFNEFDHQLVTKIYISIVTQGTRKNALHPQYLHEFLFFHFYKKHHLKELEESRLILEEITNNILKSTSRFDSKILKIIKTENSNKYYSEPLTFLHNLIHLNEQNMELDIYGTSDQLANLDIHYSFNQMELTGFATQNITYAAVFSLKPFHELSIEDCTEVLEHNFKYIIAESIVFVPRALAIKDIKKQANFLEAGRSSELGTALDINQLIAPDNNRKTDYCARQINLILFSENQNILQKSIEKMIKIFNNIGVTLVREDFFMPLCFWSIIPGNFKYNVRQSFNLTKFSSSFAFVPSTSMGSYNGSKWGPPITLFKNRKGFPYYFNFHQNDNGNTLIVGPEDSGKETLLKFLLTQSTKINPKIIYLDLRGNNDNFFNTIGGRTVKLQLLNENPAITINLKDLSVDILKNIFSFLLFDTLDLSTEQDTTLTNLITQIQTNNNLYEFFKAWADTITDQVIKNKVLNITNTLIKAFGLQDNLDIIMINNYLNIDLSSIDVPLQIIISYLIFIKIVESLNDDPTIIVINSDFKILQKKIVADNLITYLEKITSKNAILIFAIDYSKELYDDFQITEQIIYHFPTQIFLSNRKVDKIFKKTFKLSDDDFYSIRNFDHGKRSFLLKQHNKSVNLLFDLESIKEIKEDLK